MNYTLAVTVNVMGLHSGFRYRNKIGIINL